VTDRAVLLACIASKYLETGNFVHVLGHDLSRISVEAFPTGACASHLRFEATWPDGSVYQCVLPVFGVSFDWDSSTLDFGVLRPAYRAVVSAPAREAATSARRELLSWSIPPWYRGLPWAVLLAAVILILVLR